MSSTNSSESWDLGEFVSLVETKISPKAKEAMVAPLNSINHKFQRSRAHANEALKLMSPFKGTAPTSDPIQQAIAGMRMLTMTGAESQQFGENLLRANDEAAAYAQSLHSTADYLANVLYFGLGLKDRGILSLSDSQIGLPRMRRDLDPNGPLKSVHACIVEYLNTPAFQYLSAFVNTEKHRMTIPSKYSLAMSVNSVASSGLKLEPFTYAGVTYPEKWLSEFFEADMSVILVGTVAIGRAATTHLKTLT